jgi:hypothetical protein
VAFEIAEGGHALLRFYLPPEACWAVISGRQAFDWPDDEQGRTTRPKDIGEHLTKAVRAGRRHHRQRAIGHGCSTPSPASMSAAGRRSCSTPAP